MTSTRYLIIGGGMANTFLAAQGVVPQEALHWGPGFKRQYPQGESAAHVLGFVGAENVGRGGIEAAFAEVNKKGGIHGRQLRLALDRAQQVDVVRHQCVGMYGAPKFLCIFRVGNAVPCPPYDGDRIIEGWLCFANFSCVLLSS